MSANLTPQPSSTSTVTKPVSWRKKYRPQLMNTSLWLFWGGFPLAYIGGSKNDAALIALSFIVFCLACLIPLITKK